MPFIQVVDKVHWSGWWYCLFLLASGIFIFIYLSSKNNPLMMFKHLRHLWSLKELLKFIKSWFFFHFFFKMNFLFKKWLQSNEYSNLFEWRKCLILIISRWSFLCCFTSSSSSSSYRKKNENFDHFCKDANAKCAHTNANVQRTIG